MEPIVILGMPRSGSSMISGIFAQHGCWVGRCREGDSMNPKGYFENLDVKDWMIRNHGRLAQTVRMASPGEGFMAYMRLLLGSYDGPWVVKHSAMYFRAWHEFKPRFVCIRRSKKGILESNRECGYLGTKDEAAMIDIIDAHNYAMDLSGGVNVYTDSVVAGDYESLYVAFERCGLEFDPQIAHDFVEPEFWHH